MEALDGQTFDRYMRSLSLWDAPKMLAGMAQTALGLYFAQQKKQFTHYDFHSGNNFVCNTGDHYYQYYINAKTYTIFAPFTTVVIDYGNSHVKGLKKYYVDKAMVAAYGITSDKFKKTADCYTFLMHCLFILSVYNQPIIDIKVVQRLYAAVQNVYNDLFTKSISEIVTDIRNQKMNNDQAIKHFNSHRKDKKYYLYVPHDYENNYGPLELYNDIVDALRGEGFGHYVTIPSNTSVKICRWGNLPVYPMLPMACELSLPDHVENMSVKIDELKR